MSSKSGRNRKRKERQQQEKKERTQNMLSPNNTAKALGAEKFNLQGSAAKGKPTTKKSTKRWLKAAAGIIAVGAIGAGAYYVKKRHDNKQAATLAEQMGLTEDDLSIEDDTEEHREQELWQEMQSAMEQEGLEYAAGVPDESPATDSNLDTSLSDLVTPWDLPALPIKADDSIVGIGAAETLPKQKPRKPKPKAVKDN